jgi:exopolysaccharide biosynthesis polyprenyl glycosylphosphotransferase
VIDEVAICVEPGDVALIEPIARLCEDEGRLVRIPLDSAAPTLTGGRVEEFDGIEVLSLVRGPDHAAALVLKRLLDVAGAIVGLVILSPVLVAIAAWIVAVDGHPILFRQPRVGLNLRPFSVVKFRTMTVDAEQRLAEVLDRNLLVGHAFKLDDDPRLTRTGRFLRRTSLDELPQLWNVLLGQMSLVGPRPPLPREVADYDIWHRRRLSMKPGITGLWQVEARREVEFDRWVALDLSYIDRWSLWLDVKIIARTVPAMLSGR